MKKLFALLLFVLIPTVSHASENKDVDLGTIFVLGSYGVDSNSKIGKSRTVIKNPSAEGQGTLSDGIKTTEGVTVKRINGNSGNTSVRLRGTRSIDTLLMFNGMPLRDPSDPQGSANPLYGDILSSGTGKVEVLRGAASSLYGTQAVGGVINIVPSKKEGFKVSSEIGSDSTYQEGIDYGFNAGNFGNHYLSLSRLDTDGFDEHDDYEQSRVSGVSNFNFGDTNLELDYIYSRTDAMLNGAPFVRGGILNYDRDDENDTREQTLRHLGGKWQADALDGRATVSVKSSITDTNRRFTFLPNSNGTGFLSDGTYEGTSFQLNPSISINHGERFTTTLGYDYVRDWYVRRTYLDGQFNFLGQPLNDLMDESDSFHNDFYAEEVIKLDRLTLTVAGRQNTNELAKSRATYDVSGSYSLPDDTVIRSHYGTSFRTPSLNELDGSFLSAFGRTFVGNPGLSPERGSSFDIGVKKPFENFKLGSTFFRQDIINKIDFTGGTYKNMDRQDHTDGLESYISVSPIKDLSLKLTHTWTKGDSLVDIPNQQYGATAEYSFDKFKLNLSGIQKGHHNIRVFNNDTFLINTLSEKGHFEMDGKLSYFPKQNMEVYLRGENLFDAKYYEGGYRTPGARVFVGASYSF